MAVQTMIMLKSPPLGCYIVVPLASSMDPDQSVCRIGKSRPALRLGKSRRWMIWKPRQGKAKTTRHYSSACLPAADEASKAYHHLCRCKFCNACVACHHRLAGLRACTVSTTRSCFVPSLAWTLALVSTPYVPNSRYRNRTGLILTKFIENSCSIYIFK